MAYVSINKHVIPKGTQPIDHNGWNNISVLLPDVPVWGVPNCHSCPQLATVATVGQQLPTHTCCTQVEQWSSWRKCLRNVPTPRGAAGGGACGPNLPILHTDTAADTAWISSSLHDEDKDKDKEKDEDKDKDKEKDEDKDKDRPNPCYTQT